MSRQQAAQQYEDARTRRDTRGQHRAMRDLRAATNAALRKEVQGMKKVNIASIRVNGGTQSRAGINRDVVAEYAEAMQAGAEFPPLVLFFDGSTYWLADGFHRYEAYARANAHDVPAEVRQGTQRDAILYSVGANARHGLRRTNDDKRRAVMKLLEDAEWSKWSDREIARQCSVSPSTVAKHRSEVSSVTVHLDSEPRTYTTKHGSTAKMDTGNIGKRHPQPERSDCEPYAPAPPAETQDRQPVEPEPQPDPHAEARKGLSSLSREGLEDELIGLREENGDLRGKVKALKAERDEFKARWQEATAQDMGRALGNAQRARDTAKGRLQEELAKNARQGRRIKMLEAELAEATRKLEAQEVEI